MKAEPARPAAIHESRGFSKIKTFTSVREEWKDWAPVFMSFIAAVSTLLKDAMNEALEDWVTNVEESLQSPIKKKRGDWLVYEVFAGKDNLTKILKK